jgi:peptidoglycan/LPS O-acetylase OafA/YrhL
LDFLRGVAIMEVIGLHLGLPVFNRLGQIGVDIFFVLSGFLISGILIGDFRKRGTIRLKRFWVRRAFKILPPLYVFMFVMLLVLRDRQSWNGVVRSALFCMDYFPAYSQFLHTWSLSVEEQFYVFLPLLLLLLIRWKKSVDALPWVFLGVLIATFLLRTQSVQSAPFHLRADTLFTGVFLRYVVEFKPKWFQQITRFSLVPGLLFWLPALLLEALGPGHRVLSSLLYTGIDVGCGCLLVWCYARDNQMFWSWAPFRLLAQVGFYSYSIYLWQEPITTFFNRDKVGVAMSVAIGSVACILVGIGMAKLIEMPSLRLRDHWFPETVPKETSRPILAA